MAILVAEKYKGRRRNNDSAEVLYLVQGTGANVGNVFEEEAIAAVLGTPGMDEFGGLPLVDVDARNELVQGTWWEVAAIYGVNSPTFFDTGSVQYEFSYTAPVARIYYSLETRSATGPNGVAFSTSELKNKIRGQGGDEDGIDLPSPSPTNSWIYNIPNGDVSLEYQQAVESIIGSVNSATFQGRAADTMRLVGCNGGARIIGAGGTPKDWSIRFDFQFSANRTGVAFGDIVVPSIHGHNLIWDLSEEHEINVNDDPTTIRRVKAIIVERVFPRENFSQLGF